MPLDLRAAEVFVAVADELHFGRAAARVHMTQPAVSRHVSRLETALGIKLLRRTNRHVELSAEGLAFLDAVRDVLLGARQAVEAAQQAARGGIGQLRFGSAGTFPNQLAAQLVHVFRRKHSAVEVLLSQFSYISCPTAEIERDRVDLALVRAPVPTAVMFEPIVQERRLLALSAKHPFSAREVIALEEIATEPIVTSTSWPPRLRDYWAGVNDGANPAYEVGAVVNGPEEWLNAVAAGRGVSLCPASVAGYFQRDDLTFVAIEDLALCRIGLAWRRGYSAPQLRDFVAIAKAYLDAPRMERPNPNGFG